MLYTLSALYMHDVADRILNGQKPKQAPIAEITRSAPAEKDWDKIVEDVAKRSDKSVPQKASQQTKQTEYTAATYVPAHAVNVMPATKIHPNSVQVQQPKKQQEIVIIGKERRVRDFCPYKEGSIERRNCKMAVDLHTRN